MQVQNNSQTSKPSQSINPPLGASPVVPSSSPVATRPATTQAKPILATPSILNKTDSVVPTARATSVASAEKDSFSEKDLKVKLNKSKGPRSKKQIPTILGLLILFVALISGVLLFGQGTGVFAPRATAQTTPKNIRISNVTDKTFTISFYTDESTTASIKYGESEKSLDKQASDDRDQLSGVVKDYRLHQITVRALSPNQDYFYELIVNSSSFDNEGQPYVLKTALKPSQSPNNSQTIYGNVFNTDGSAAEGAIVYLYSEGMGTLSSLVKSSGSWGISLSNAFNTEKSGYAVVTDESPLDIKIQGIEPDLLSSLQLTVVAAQPVPNITLGQNEVVADASSSLVDKEELLADAETSSSSTLLESTPSAEGSESAVLIEQSSSSGALQDLLSNDGINEEPEVLNLDELSESQEASATTITTTQPQIKATLPANTMVRVIIHSDTQIDETVQTDANGDLILDVASLGKNLEPGVHTASYTYIDPTTGEEITKTYSFTVDPSADSRQLAAVVTTPTPTTIPTVTPTVAVPYGSGNPYVPTISATPTAIISSAVSTRSAVVSTTSGQYSAGSVGTTIALLFGGLFFVAAGVWSYLLANSFEEKRS
ncbi:MAG: hypothetical protein UT13_C0001G0120 [Candidatus Pacebacteria bacterium GW2011_GWF2_38_9]|nr:MAG: hypothetical protein US01_C0001G0120 [candidate division TM6 bacterium GW2011_GWF2_28_16]KKQ09563.1 MAG: hypothetical protein US20_C0006G0017 [Candidatus Pacebacteria bacterium GW2011_GWF1_36_5]KKQ88473.1 MAG: hypothetical protein UT13_C0001G0120 [Candidatus Pacebacteria bacterium GW2011_GWF2_38_9]HAZ73392.1 hypothetical protein [Candidatus Paceibacterota bacterium]